MTQQKIRIAIIGGGLAGCFLMNALAKYPQLDAHIYEANAEIKERGASVGLQPHAQRALRALGLESIVKKAGGVEAGCFRMVVGEGKDAGKTIIELPNDARVLHRAALLRELLASIPKEKIHFNKRLSDVKGSTIHFADGSTAEADLIIGADGIHGNVRKYVLGEGHPAVQPLHANFYDGREVVSLDEAAEKLGTDNIDKEHPRQQMYFGKGRIFYQETMDDATRICIVVAGIMPPEWDRTQWKHTVSREWLMDEFKCYGDFGRKMLELFCNGKDEKQVFAEWESATAPKLYNDKGTICMMGDAAHATTPWQAAGLAQAIEDSLILSTALGDCHTPRDVPSALEAYDQIMRPRGIKTVKSSREAGLVMCGQDGLDAKELHDTLPPRWADMFGWDTEAAVKQVVDLSHQLRSQNGHK